MIKPHRRQECTRTVASATTHAGWNMPCRFALNMNAVMAGLASTFLHHDVAENQPGKAG